MYVKNNQLSNTLTPSILQPTAAVAYCRSDPQPLQGRSFSKRGVGYSFGSDYTHAFLATNNLELIVRSHEVKDEGYVVEHGGTTPHPPSSHSPEPLHPPPPTSHSSTSFTIL